MAGTLAVAGEAASGVTLRLYNENGSAGWTANHGATIYAVAMDSAGNVFIGGDAGTDGYTVRKYDINGALVWSYDHGATVYSIAIDPDGNLFIGGAAGTDGYEARKLSADGTTSLWGVTHGATVYGVAAFPDNSSVSMVLTGAAGSGGYTTRCRFTAGGSYWNYAHGATTYSVVIKSSGVFIAGDASGGYTTRYLYTAGGTLAGSFNLGATARTICNGDADNPGSFYILYAGDSNGSITTVRHFYSVETLLSWTANHGATVYGSIANADGEFYTVGAASSGVNVRKYSASGTLDSAWNLTHGATLYAVAWSSAGLSAQTLAPALRLALNLAVPAFVGSTLDAPALRLALNLSPPTVTAPPVPPDWTGPPPQTLYRGYLTGGAELLELPLASLQCHRRLGASTWLTLDIPAYSAGLAAAIAARSGGQLVIYAGIRSAAGVETMGEMMRAWLTETAITREAHDARIVLTGRIIPVSFTAQTRTLRAIETIGRDKEGRWQVRCAVDPLLRPNDTAIFGVRSMTVGTLTYRIAPGESWMDVAEAAA